MFIEPLIRDVTKPEDLFESNLTTCNNVLLDISTPSLINTDTSLTQNDHNDGRYIIFRPFYSNILYVNKKIMYFIF